MGAGACVSHRWGRLAIAAALACVLVSVLAGPTGVTQTATAASSVVQFPGTFELEDYKPGGQGIGYYDTTRGNSGGAYRNDDVDLQACNDGPGCINVGWVKPGEWLAYDIEVVTSGEFVLDTRVASPHNGRSFAYLIDGRDVTGAIDVPNTGSHQAWATVSSPPIMLESGRYELRLVAHESSFNLNSVTVRQTYPPTPPTPPVPSTPQSEQAVATPAYYVAPDGSDSADGSLQSPRRSIGASMKKLVAGDTLIVRGGTYYERVEVRGESVPRGTPEARITVMAAPDENPVVVGIFWVSNADYWTFDNIDVRWDDNNRNSEETMVRLYEGHGWVWANSELSGARSYAGLAVSGGSTGWTITGNYIHDTHSSNDTSQDHLIYISSGSDGVIERNLLMNAPNGRGVKLGVPSSGSTLPANVIVRYNTIVNTGAGNVSLSYDAHSNQIYRNIMVTATNGYHSVNDWNCTGGNNVVADNVTFDSRGVYRATANFVDGGGNVTDDPQFDEKFKPQNPRLYDAEGVLQYGHLAGVGR